MRCASSRKACSIAPSGPSRHTSTAATIKRSARWPRRCARRRGPQTGVTEAVGIWLDLDRGTCREEKVVSQGDAERAAFVIAGDYAQWKRVIRKELGPIAGIMQRKLSLKGSLPIVVRFVKSAEQLVQAATTLATKFLDE